MELFTRDVWNVFGFTINIFFWTKAELIQTNPWRMLGFASLPFFTGKETQTVATKQPAS